MFACVSVWRSHIFPLHTSDADTKRCCGEADTAAPGPVLLIRGSCGGVAGLFVYGVGTYSAMLYFGCGGLGGCGGGCGHSVDADGSDGGGVVTEDERRRAYDQGAQTYEKDVCVHEAWMGITALRKSLLQKAAGNVLEVAAGTGHNFPLYPASCSVTAIDCSRGMVEVARGAAAPPVMAVEEMEVEQIRFPAHSFDTVVDTFGLSLSLSPPPPPPPLYPSPLSLARSRAHTHTLYTYVCIYVCM
jgi:hypothetical protein